MIELTPQNPSKVRAGKVEVLKLLADPKGIREDYIFSYLVVGGEGRVLVETGPKNSFETLKESLREKGFSLNEIDAVFLTHIHLDHAGAAGLVAKECGCPIYVHPRGLPHLLDPSRLNSAAERTLGEFVYTAYGPAEPLEGSKAVSTEDNKVYHVKDIEIKVIFTPGHAPHHQSLVTNGVLFPGDSLGEVTVWSGAYTPTTPHRTMPGMMVNSIRKMMFENVKVIAYTHRGMIEGKDEVLAQMKGAEEQLRTWVHVALVHSKKCGLDVNCYAKYLYLADPLYRKLVDEGELERSKLLQNSVRMSMDGIARYVLGVK